jgi:hypothetical protein
MSYKPGSGGLKEELDEDDDRSDTSAENQARTESIPTADSASDEDSSEQSPYYRRRSNARDERVARQTYLREDVLELEDEVVDELQDLPGEDILRFDVREAAYIVGLQNPDELVEVLKEDGLVVESPD